jgi:hypothetical protein
MVAGFQDVLDSDDDLQIHQKRVFSADLELSSDDEVEAGKHTAVIPTQDLDFDKDVKTRSSKSKSDDTSSSDSQSRPLVTKTRTSQFLSPEQKSSQMNNSATDHLKLKIPSSKKQTLKELSKSCNKQPEDSHNGDVQQLEDSDDELTNQVTVLQDVEDVSDKETTTSSSKPVDSGLVTDTTMVCHMFILLPYTQSKRLLLYSKPCLLSALLLHQRIPLF